MALTFRQVRHFVATAETGKVSAAAASLNVTQSAVTASIKALEADLGQKEAEFEKTQAELEKASEEHLSHMEGGKAAEVALKQKAKIESE